MTASRGPLPRSRPLPALLARFDGAPLDAVKVAAALLMVVDHVNTALLGNAVPLMWRFGRIAYPLFCFALACHFARGIEPSRYVRALLVAAVLTQPAFAAAFRGDAGNVLFTLAAGMALASALAGADPRLRHGVFALGAIVVFAWPLRARTGVDFGLAGALYPAALALGLSRDRLCLLWVPVLLAGLNAGGVQTGETPLVTGILDALFAGIGSVLVLGASLALAGRNRFLPRYALHVFYPGHLAVLALLRWAGGA